jgi:hypothetical protein
LEGLGAEAMIPYITLPHPYTASVGEPLNSKSKIPVSNKCFLFNHPLKRGQGYLALVE